MWSGETLEISTLSLSLPNAEIKGMGSCTWPYFGSSGFGVCSLVVWRYIAQAGLELCSSGVLKLGIHLPLPPSLRVQV